MIQLFKTNYLFTYFILFAFLVISRLGLLFTSDSLLIQTTQFSFVWLYFESSLLGLSHTSLIVLDIILCFLTAMLVNYIFISQKFMDRGSLVSAFVFILVSAMFPDWMFLNGVNIALFLLTISVYFLLQLLNDESSRLVIFYSGLFLCFSGLFYAPVFFLLPAFLFVLLLRLRQRADYMLFFISVLIPIFFIGIYFYYVSELESYMAFWKEVFITRFSLPIIPGKESIFLGFMGILALFGYYKLSHEDNFKVIQIRRAYLFLGIGATLLLIGFLLVNSDALEYAQLFSFPLSAYITVFFIRERFVWWVNLCFILIFLGIAYFQLSPFLAFFSF